MFPLYSAEGAKPGVYIEESNSYIDCIINALIGFYFGDCIIKKGARYFWGKIKK